MSRVRDVGLRLNGLVPALAMPGLASEAQMSLWQFREGRYARLGDSRAKTLM